MTTVNGQSKADTCVEDWNLGSRLSWELPTVETAVNFIDNVPRGGDTVLVLERG